MFLLFLWKSGNNQYKYENHNMFFVFVLFLLFVSFCLYWLRIYLLWNPSNNTCLFFTLLFFISLFEVDLATITTLVGVFSVLLYNEKNYNSKVQVNLIFFSLFCYPFFLLDVFFFFGLKQKLDPKMYNKILGKNCFF